MKKVKIYSTQTCPWCIKTRDYMKENKIEFEEKDVSTDEVSRSEMVEKSGQMGVPVIIVEGSDPIVGFNIQAIKDALK